MKISPSALATSHLGALRAQGHAHVQPRPYAGGQVTSAHTHGGQVDAFTYRAKMDIDSDGGNVSKRRDPWHQGDTSFHLDGQPVDAVHVPYIVLPPSLARASGTKLGDLVQVSYRGKTVYAIFADFGPRGKLGEASMALAHQLGINDDPMNGGLQSPGVTYTVLPGTGHLVKGAAHQIAQHPAELQAIGERAFAAAKAQGEVG